MNVAQPGYQAYLADRAVELLGAGYDGLQLDNVETSTSYLPRYVGSYVSGLPVELDEAGWYAGEVAMLRAVRTTVKAAGYGDRVILFNHIRAGEPERALEYLAEADGANSEGWMTAQVPLEDRWGWRSRVRLIEQAHAAAKRTNLLALDDTPTEAEALFCFVSYLMAYRDEGSTFWYGDLYRAESMRWYAFYEAKLGAPVAAMAAAA